VFLAYGIESVGDESCFARLFDYNGDMLLFTALRVQLRSRLRISFNLLVYSMFTDPPTPRQTAPTGTRVTTGVDEKQWRWAFTAAARQTAHAMASATLGH
jgi:hypothetical protein